jgi:glycosyltransferase involved in cell wall biosynthesis
MNAERRRVLFVIPGLQGGGAQRFVSTLLRHLDRGCIDPHLAVLEAKEDLKQFLPPDVVVHNLKSSRIRYALPAIVRLVRKINPGVVLSTLSAANLALILGRAWFPSGTRVLVREASLASVALKDQRNPLLWEWLYRRCYKRADAVICSSDSMAEDLVTHFGVPRTKVVRIYNPIDVKMVRDMADRGGNPFVGAGPHLVAAARLSREKGLDILLAAMPAVLACHPGAQLTVLGEGPLWNELRDQADKLNLTQVVHFLGFQRNPWSYLRHADLFVLPSRYEGLPNVLLEALALGTPVVAADCPGAIREVHPLSQGMTLVPPENPAALARSIIEFCRAPRQSRSLREPFDASLDRFDLKNIVDEYCVLLSS